ncbi:Serine/threonine-protein kinase Sgk3 [Liparis tanakae]|uniref:Serine/threonine-protein kinase Sgk3 n=1 Tax=Liparis tanakae TaxID=230148 RepID=A0A4Z2JF76_9TELE|nr:Serine/threonine-protein kinase Sgk3 [Liparis tanakae]
MPTAPKMEEQPSHPNVSIPCHDEQRDKKKRYTVYKVIVNVGQQEWFVFRRYAEFDKLYNTLRKQFPSMNLKIPAKRIFGDNFDPEFIKQRRAGLHEFIKRIVSHPQLCNQPDVRTFLLMDKMQNLSDASEDEDDKNNSTSRIINLGPSGNPHAKPTDFDFLKVIGKGSFGKQKHIMAERNVLLKNVKHPFLVGLHYSFQTTDKLYFVLDFVNGGEGHIVLTDFGLCKEGISQTDTTTTFCGTPEYLAPEVLKKQPYDNTVDWWCLGSVLYEMLFGLPPFYSRDTHEMYDNILHKTLVIRPGASSTAWTLLQGLLEKDGTHRLGSRDDFHEIKAHSFFSSINWDDLEQKKIPPPFTPNVSSYCDISNFDPEFTDEMVPNSICWSKDHSIINASVMEADDAFVGFSYAPASDDSFL